jgi:PAS domain S-box-containing protein
VSDNSAPAIGRGLDAAVAWLAESTDDAVWLYDRTSARIVYANSACAALWGLPREALLADASRLLEALHPEDRALLRAEELLEPAKPFLRELRLADGARRVQHRGVPLGAAGAEPHATLGITRDVSAVLRAEEARRESEQRFEVLARSAFELITELDSRGRMLWTNKTVPGAKIQRPVEVSPRPRPDLIHPEDREQTVTRFSAAMRERHDTLIEFRTADVDGNWRWLETTVSPYATLAGERRALLMSRDVTERREMVERLRVSEERFRLLADNATDLIEEFDGEGRLLYANPRAVLALGTTLEEFYQRAPLERMHPEDRKDLARAFQRLLQTGESFTISVRGAHQDGTWHWFESNVHAHLNAQGERRVVLISRDVTARRAAEESLRESEERYRQLVEQSPLGIAVHSDGKLVYANPAAVRLTGAVSAADLVGREFLDLVDSESAAEVTAQLARLSSGARIEESAEIKLRRRDGGARVVIGKGSLVGYGGRPAFQFVMSDISERKQAEQERERLQSQLQEARKLESLGVLAGGIAHDFNNLLAVVLGNVRFVLGRLPEDDEARGALDDAANAGESAARLTRQLLAYAGRRAPEVRTLDLSDHARSVSGLLEAAVPKKVRLTLELAARLPAVRADVAQLEQVTMNLVLNAAEAIGEGEGTLRIATGTVSATRSDVRSWIGAQNLEPGDYVYLEVSDDGCGMDEETQRRIFDPFFTTKQKGHGLGLSAVLGLVRGHGGGISLTSRLGVGTRIRVLLPASEPIAAVEAPRFSVGGALRATVLVVDDEPLIRRAVSRILSASHCRVLEAGDGLEAVEQFRRHQSMIDLVLLDLNMPRAGGEEALRRLRELEPRLPVLLASGYDGVELAQRLGDPDRTGFIAKPFLDSELLGRIERLLGAR